MPANQKHFGAKFAPCGGTVNYCRWSTSDPFAIIGYHDFDHRLRPGNYKKKNQQYIKL